LGVLKGISEDSVAKAGPHKTGYQGCMSSIEVDAIKDLESYNSDYVGKNGLPRVTQSHETGRWHPTLKGVDQWGPGVNLRDRRRTTLSQHRDAHQAGGVPSPSDPPPAC